MNVEQKRLKSRGFIKSELTEATHTVLALFNRNAQNLLNAISLEGVLLDRIEKGEIDTGLPDDLRIETKNFILLHGLAKIMMLIEGFFALCEATSNHRIGYKKLPESMTYYRPRDIRNFIRRLKQDKVDLHSLFRFPEVNKLMLTSKEAIFLKKLMADSCMLLKKTMLEIIEFYECNSIPYNKLKHGLSILAGMRLSGPEEGKEYPSIVIYALDRKRA